MLFFIQNCEEREKLHIIALGVLFPIVSTYHWERAHRAIIGGGGGGRVGKEEMSMRRDCI